MGQQGCRRQLDRLGDTAGCNVLRKLALRHTCIKRPTLQGTRAAEHAQLGEQRLPLCSRSCWGFVLHCGPCAAPAEAGLCSSTSVALLSDAKVEHCPWGGRVNRQAGALCANPHLPISKSPAAPREHAIPAPSSGTASQLPCQQHQMYPLGRLHPPTYSCVECAPCRLLGSAQPASASQRRHWTLCCPPRFTPNADQLAHSLRTAPRKDCAARGGSIALYVCLPLSPSVAMLATPVSHALRVRGVSVSLVARARHRAIRSACTGCPRPAPCARRPPARCCMQWAVPCPAACPAQPCRRRGHGRWLHCSPRACAVQRLQRAARCESVPLRGLPLQQKAVRLPLRPLLALGTAAGT